MKSDGPPIRVVVAGSRFLWFRIFLWTFIFFIFSHKKRLSHSNPGGATTTVLRPSGFLLNVSHGIEVLTGCLSFLLNVSHGIEVWTCIIFILAECLARSGCFDLQNVDFC